MSNTHSDQPNSRLPKVVNGSPKKLTIVRLALSFEDVELVKHTLRQTITATELVMKQGHWPIAVKVQRGDEVRTLRKTLETIEGQQEIGGG